MIVRDGEVIGEGFHAELLVLPGMGHDLARRLWPDVLDGIERTVRRGEATPAG